MPRVRRRAIFSGRVQGVGFRFTCQSLSRGFDVAGYVRNLPDGNVELMAEGDPIELDKFVRAIELEMGGFIRDVEIRVASDSSEPLLGFSIRH